MKLIELISVTRNGFETNRFCFDPHEVAAVEEELDQTVIILKCGEHLQTPETYRSVITKIEEGWQE